MKERAAADLGGGPRAATRAGSPAGVELRAGKRWCVARSHAPGPGAEGARARHAEQREFHTRRSVLVLTRSASLTPRGLLVRRHATDKTMTISSSCSSSATAVRACGAGRLVARTPEANASAAASAAVACRGPSSPRPARALPSRASEHLVHKGQKPPPLPIYEKRADTLPPLQTNTLLHTVHLGYGASPGQRTPLALFFPIASLCARVCVRRG